MAICEFAICGPYISWKLWICNLWAQLFLAGLKLQEISKYIIFLPTNICPKCCHSIIRSTYIVFRCLIYTCVAKNSIRANDLDQKHCHFPCKFEDLRSADWVTKEICGFAICGLIITNVADRHGTVTPQKFADLRSRNKPKICGFVIYGLAKNFACPPLYFYTRDEFSRKWPILWNNFFREKRHFCFNPKTDQGFFLTTSEYVWTNKQTSAWEHRSYPDTRHCTKKQVNITSVPEPWNSWGGAAVFLRRSSCILEEEQLYSWGGSAVFLRRSMLCSWYHAVEETET